MNKRKKTVNRKVNHKNKSKFITFLTSLILITVLSFSAIYTYNYATKTVFASDNESVLIIEELQNTVLGLQSEINSLSEEINLLEENNKTLTLNLNNTTSLKENLETQLTDKNNVINGLETQVVMLENNILNLEEELNNLLLESNLNIELIEDLSSNISLLQNELSAKVEELNVQNLELETLETEILSLQNQIIELEEEIAVTESELSFLNHENNMLRTSLENVLELLDNDEYLREVAESIITPLEIEIADLESTVSHLENEYANLLGTLRNAGLYIVNEYDLTVSHDGYEPVGLIKSKAIVPGTMESLTDIYMSNYNSFVSYNLNRNVIEFYYSMWASNKVPFEFNVSFFSSGGEILSNNSFVISVDGDISYVEVPENTMFINIEVVDVAINFNEIIYMFTPIIEDMHAIKYTATREDYINLFENDVFGSFGITTELQPANDGTNNYNLIVAELVFSKYYAFELELFDIDNTIIDTIYVAGTVVNLNELSELTDLSIVKGIHINYSESTA